MNTEVIEITVTEDENKEKCDVKIRVEENTKKNTFRTLISVTPEDIDIFKSYVELCDINAKDNFQLEILHEEVNLTFQDLEEFEI